MADDSTIQLAPARFVTIPLASIVTGFTEKAIERKIESGVWIEGREYVRRDGRVLIDLRGYERWAESGHGTGITNGTRRRHSRQLDQDHVHV